ncbi:cobalamin B12-binding domain-containing protein [Murimonas intestini]|mgnify:CR=1 FL=1|uniref:Methylmalonyl-CoA mutase cobalamin-binding domain/chain n=1 Tax=Murimonas intestini TaxID=1337051 RepID=A0AB73T5W1_9FIRM|nr:cobalamin-dependent protein [Murimonas intestini]MCR1839624.1 cobalamin-dependent protein [Murimonas intestini]MCR1866467.1 cobalamin-dependent protein [Murimonas intestini]MCR1882415.1 cobalamin-dependent protein [Murimonas intestini]
MLDYEALKEAMGDLEEDVVLEIMNKVMEDGGEQAGQAMKACQEGMNIVGERFATQEYFVSDLIFSGELMNEAMDIIRPALLKSTGESMGKMILCTVEGDLHDIGKNIVKAMLEASGFSVIDLGIDVKPSDIVRTAKEEGITIIGLSGVLTLAIDAMKATVEAFKDAGMRQDVKIIIGGAPVNQAVCDVVGADSWAVNPADTIKMCREWSHAA